MKLFKGEKIYIGKDVHKTQWTICAVTEHTYFRTFNIGADLKVLILKHALIGKHDPLSEVIHTLMYDLHGLNPPP